MKKILLGLALITGLVLTSCGDQPAGEVLRPQAETLDINGKLYDVRWVRMNEGGYGIYILIPRDSTTKVPEVVSWSETHGKSTVQQTVIKVD